MSVIEKLLDDRRLPDVLRFKDGRAVTPDTWDERRAEILSILEEEIYGKAPEAPKITVTKADGKPRFSDFAGKAVSTELTISFDTEKGKFSFPVAEIRPKKDGRVPVIVLVNFRSDIPDRYCPVEEIIDRGCAVLRIYYNDIAFDGNDGFAGGLASMYDRSVYTWGKIRMWAWAASRVMDYLQTTDYADLDRTAVTGHSRLGKTSLVCAAFDTRFKLACANNSGCSGDAITRDKKGEKIRQITKNFPYWFCDKYRDYVDKEHELPFDQHFLVAAIAPRRVNLGAAIDDEWADPDSQYLSACAASRAWELLGKKGFEHPDRLPRPEEYFEEGNLCYHLRNGAHFYSRTDWLVYLDSIESMKKCDK